jgi:hypothetical protein
MSSRKKNENDFRAYPVLLFRDGPKKKFGTILALDRTRKRSGFGSVRASREVSFESTNKNNSSLPDIKIPRRGESPPLIPCVLASHPEPAKALRDQLMASVCHYKIYKDTELIYLIKRTFKEHPHLNRDDVKAALREVTRYLSITLK